LGSDLLLQLEDLNKILSNKNRKQINYSIYESIIRVSTISKKNTHYPICCEVLNSASMSTKYVQTAGPLNPSLKILQRFDYIGDQRELKLAQTIPGTCKSFNFTMDVFEIHLTNLIA